MRNLSILLAFIMSFSSLAQEIPSSLMETPVQTLERSDPSPAVVCEEPPARDPLCSDLAAFTCAPGEYDDGTGVSRGGTAREDLINRQKIESRPRLKNRFEEALRSPEKAYFRQIALSATGLAGSPECTGSQTERCNSRIAEGLSTLSVQRLFPPQDAYPGGGSHWNMMGELKDMDYLLNSPDFQEIERAEAAGIRTQLTDPAFEARLKNVIFPEVRRHILEVVSSRITDETIRRALTTKISSIRFEGSDCSEVSGSAGGPSLNSILIPNAFYNAQSNIFKYCNGFLLTDRSEFKIASVIAHELGHSIDPCNIARGPSSMKFSYQSNERAAMEQENPFREVIACLRTPESVNARSMQPFGMPMPYPAGGMVSGGGMAAGMPGGGFPQGGMVSGGMAGGVTLQPEESTPEDGLASGGMAGGLAGGSTPETGNASGGMAGGGMPAPMPFPPFGTTAVAPGNPMCSGDQIGESFSDWLSTEVLPRYMQARHPNLTKDQFRYGYSNIFRGMCNNLEQKTPMLGGMDPHPPIQGRVNKIFLAHPEVRRQMGCENDQAPVPPYCGRRQ